MTVAVQRASDGARSVLVLDLRVTRPDNRIAPHGTGITPAQVRELIRTAIAAGWDPGRGGTFRIEIPSVLDTIGAVSRRARRLTSSRR
ncbi:hypothetical protein [Sandaracinus amylolyticus]|uniref:hypothetical protein n=1 Tax=Sandaracinus amylolyticus TaxID=927083 RepID=UPI001F489221|nr:hypothetical protein [Sandaracinus amylolyticus]